MTNNEILYTHKATPVSTAVEQIWYNFNTKELFLDLHNVVYKYSNVPMGVYTDFLNADSKGQYYRDEIRNYSPASRLGPAANLTKRVDPAPHAFRAEEVKPWRVPGTVFTAPTTASTPQLSLAKDVDNTDFPHEFTFVLDGSDAERKHTIKAGGMDVAIEQMFEFANLFNTAIRLKAVTVYFE